jgi:hypothetical protein
MPNSFDLLIQELKALMKKISDDGSNTQTTGLLYLLRTATLTDPNNNAVSKELKDIMAAFTSQNTYTDSTLAFLNSLHLPTATLETLKTATNLIQIYFQVTQPLEQILSDLIDNLPPAAEVKGGVTSAKIQASIKIIKTDRQDLQKVQDKALQEFGSVLEELDLQKLVQTSSVILIELKNSPNLDVLSTAIDRLISHLKNEPNEIQKLINNWGNPVAQIETIEKTNPDIQSGLSDPSKSRLAIAQSIKIHDLLEANYDYLNALVRSVDLVSAGSL